MGTKYTSQATSGYNASPPADDGSQTASNLITWAGIKTKFTDVLKTFAEAINTALVAALDTSCRAISSNDSAVAGDHWRTLEVTNTTTVTLPAASTAGAGWVTDVYNDGTGVVTVALTGPDTINNVSSAVTIPALNTWTFKVNSGANGYNIVAKATEYGVKGADIAAAGTTNLATATGGYVDITGSAVVTALGTAAAGVIRKVRFAAASTLTHNGTSLILPGAADITVVAGDAAEFVSEGSGNWRCLHYLRAAVRPFSRGTLASTFTFDGSGGSTGSLTMEWMRVGNFVTLFIPTAQATTGTGSTVLASDTALPADIRPSANTQYQLSVPGYNNGAALTAPALGAITTGGLVQIFRDGAGTAFTNTAVGGTAGNSTISYYAG